MRPLRKFWQYCLAGLLMLVPTWATFLILAAMFHTLDNLLLDLIGTGAEPYVPGLGLVLLVVLVVGVGAIATHIVGQRLLRWAEMWLERIPLIRSIYLTLKSMTDLLNYRISLRAEHCCRVSFSTRRALGAGIRDGNASGGPSSRVHS